MAGSGYGGYGGQGYGGQGYGYGQPARNPIPPGWFECPCIGTVSSLHKMIPMKVPLGNNRRVPNMEILSKGHWTPLLALYEADRIIKEQDPGGTVGTVLDLTNTDKYYDVNAIEQSNVRYVKVPCRGRGESPDPLAVNMAVWEIRKALAAEPMNYILVHCTHGYNRSGFIIVCAMMRLLADQGYCVVRGLKRFKEQRPPGIYKDGYIKDLFRRHNEHRPSGDVARAPALPAWKPADDDEEDERLGNGYHSMPEPQVGGRLSHTDKIGEPVPTEEARYIMNCVYDIIQAQDTRLKGSVLTGFPHLQESHRGPGDLFIGSQPVSLDLENLDLVKQKRYYVTWKADGTRYMLLCMREGVYFIDRSGEVRRAHMRFPTFRQPKSSKEHPVGPPHHWTLLDGELVVDEVDISGEQQRRRFLVYDCMMLSGEGISDLRFKDRWFLIQREVEFPRVNERKFFGTDFKKDPCRQMIYDYEMEVCSVRRKDFYPLQQAHSLLTKFIPRLCHESDGLILQPSDDPYIPRTYPHLLKWKFRHMNSVDFKLHAQPGQPPALMLNCAMRRKGRQADTNHLPLSDIGVPHAMVEFGPEVDPTSLHGKIIECSFDAERRVWIYMRDRPDKLTANHRSVFDKVMASIEDNITEEFLLGVFDEALKLPFYASDAQRAQTGTVPGHSLPLPSGAPPEQQQQQQHGKPLVTQQQHRQGTPEVQQQPGQLSAGPGFRGPSPILTPPPGADNADPGGNEQQQPQHGKFNPPSANKTADHGVGFTAGSSKVARQNVQSALQQEDEAMDDINQVDMNDLQDVVTGFDDDMQQQQQGEDDDEEPYHVTEQGGSDGEGDMDEQR